MNTEAYKLARATLRTAVKEYGWSRRDPNNDAALGYPVAYTSGPGKFEGEHWAIVHYFDDCGGGEPFYFGGDEMECEAFELDETERQAFGFAPDTMYVALCYSSQGFVSLEEWDEDMWTENVRREELASGM